MILYVLHLRQTQVDSEKTTEKQPSHNWKLFAKSMCFGLSSLCQAASVHLFVLGSGVERSNQKAAKDYISLSFS